VEGKAVFPSWESPFRDPFFLKRFKFIQELADILDKFPGRTAAMITVTRLNNSPLVINPDLIVSIEETPDTIITLSNGEKITVQEKVKEVIHRVIHFRRCIFNPSIPIE
jgi:flagellar protein FlbD